MVRVVLAVLIIVLVPFAAAAADVWQQLQPAPIPPLEHNWPSTVAVLAGDGVPGTVDGIGSRARFSEPFGIVAAADGTIFVADAGHSDRIRRIAPDGTVSDWVGPLLLDPGSHRFDLGF